MSGVSTVFDAFVSKINSVLSNHVRLHNPYLVEDNPELKLKLGFGVRLGAGTNGEKFSPLDALGFRRTVVVVLTRKVAALENDAATKATGEKLLTEDAMTLIKAVHADSTLNGSVKRTVYASDSGVGFIFGEDGNYLFTEVSFATEYFEDLT